MVRISIKDLPVLEELSEQEMSDVLGGWGSGGCNLNAVQVSNNDDATSGRNSNGNGQDNQGRDH